MSIFEFFGYLSSVLVFSTFCMKTMIPLRLAGIASNVSFIIYGLIGGLAPIYILHMLLLPLNIYRLIQIKRLIKNVTEASKGNLHFDVLVPFMRKESHKKGDILFSKGDDGDKLYFVKEGLLRIEEFDKSIQPGDFVGELAIFSKYHKRTATAVCKDDMVLYSINSEDVLKLYYQDPEFAFKTIQLILTRVLTGPEQPDRI